MRASTLKGQKMDMDNRPDPVVEPVYPLGFRRHFEDQGNTPHNTSEMRDLILKQARGRSVMSFDVFDTLLLRTDVPEAERFLEISHEMRARLPEDLIAELGLAEITAQDILMVRIEAFRFTYRTGRRIEGCVEGALDDLLAQIARMLDPGGRFTDRLVPLLRAAELAVEAASLHPNQAVLQAIEAFRNNGGRVILISDMYMRGGDIRALIDMLAPGTMAQVERLWSSADEIVSKRSGKIFSRIEAELGEPAEAFVHFGDALPGDFVRPRECGWAAGHLPVPRKAIARRKERLQRFVLAQAELGWDVRSWAKI